MLELTTTDLTTDNDSTTTTKAVYATLNSALLAVDAKVEELRARYGDGEELGESWKVGYWVRGKVFFYHEVH